MSNPSISDACDPVPLRTGRRRRWRGEFRVEGVVLGKPFAQVARNQLYDLGEQDLLEVYFRAGPAPSNFKLGLLKTSYVLNAAHTMTDVAAQELSSSNNGGYSSRKTITRDATGWPTSEFADGNWHVTSAQVMWTATGPWTDTAGYIFIMTGGILTPGDTDGKILAVAPLDPTRRLQTANDVVKGAYDVKFQ